MSRNEALQFINVAHFFDHFFLLIFPTAALAIAPAWGMSFADVLLFGSPLYVMFAIGTLPAGWLGDRFDRLVLIAVFYIGCGISSVFISLATGPIALALGLGALGLFAAIYHPVGLAHVTEIGLRTGRALAINGVFGNLGLAGATLTTGILAQFFGWQSAFALPGVIAIGIGVVLGFRYRRGTKRGQVGQNNSTSHPHSFGRPIQARVFVVVCIAALCGGIVFNVVTISLPKLLDEKLGTDSINLAWIGASASLIFTVAAFAQLPVGELLDRIGARPILLGLLACETFALLALSQATGIAALVCALALVTVIFAGIPITTWLVGHYLDPDIRSRAVSIEYILSLGVGSVAVPLISMLHNAGFSLSQQMIGLSLATAIIFTASLFLPRTARNETS